MAKTKKKIYLMICGHFSEFSGKDILQKMPELTFISDVEPILVFEKPSVDMTPEVLIKLAAEIYKRIDKADGFVVLHNIDNAIYSSSVLTFLLQNITKPVVFTGGNLSGKKEGFKANLINSIQAAGFDFSEVCLMFGNRLLRASQTSRVVQENLNVFTAPTPAILGRVDFSVRIFDKLISRNKDKTKLFDKLNVNFEVVNISPLINFKELTKRLTGKDGVIVRAEDYQALPADLLFVLEKITSDVPVVIWSRKIEASPLVSSNMILVNNMTYEATEAKFAWALAQAKDIKKVKELMIKNIAGELIL